MSQLLPTCGTPMSAGAPCVSSGAGRAAAARRSSRPAPPRPGRREATRGRGARAPSSDRRARVPSLHAASLPSSCCGTLPDATGLCDAAASPWRRRRVKVELTEYPYFAGTMMTPDTALLDQLATEYAARQRNDSAGDDTVPLRRRSRRAVRHHLHRRRSRAAPTRLVSLAVPPVGLLRRAVAPRRAPEVGAQPHDRERQPPTERGAVHGGGRRRQADPRPRRRRRRPRVQRREPLRPAESRERAGPGTRARRPVRLQRGIHAPDRGEAAGGARHSGRPRGVSRTVPTARSSASTGPIASARCERSIPSPRS